MAKETHGNVELERAQVAYEEMVRISSIGFHDRWQSERTNRVNVKGKVRHLMLVPAWKTGIRISLRGTASSADYI